MKKFVKIGLWIVVVALVIIALAATAVALFFPKEKAKDMALERLSTALNREVKIDDVEISFWGGLGVYLKGIKIANPRGFTWDQFMQAKALDVKLKFWPLLKGEIAVDRSILEEPRVGLFKTREGQVNYLFGVIDSLTPEPMKGKMSEESKVAATAISFENLSIVDGYIDYVNDSSQTGVSIYGLNMNSRLKNPSTGIFNFSGHASMDSVNVRTAETTYPSLQIDADYSAVADLNKNQAVVKDTRMKVNGVELQINAGIPNLQTFNFVNVEINSKDSYLGNILALAPDKYRKMVDEFNIDGRLNLNAVVKYNANNEPDPITYNGTLNLNNLNISGKSNSGTAKIASLKVDFNPTDFKAAIEEGKIQLGFFEPFVDSTGETELSGTLDLNLTAAGKIANPYDLSMSGNIALPDGRYATPTMAEPIEKIDLAINLSKRAIDIQKLNLNFVSSDLSLTGKLSDPFPGLIPGYEGQAKKPFLSFNLSSNNFDYDKMFPDTMQGNAGETAASDSIPLSIPLPDINGAGKGKFGHLVYKEIDFTDITTDISIKDRIIRMDNIDGDVYTGKVAGDFELNLNDPKRPEYTGNYRAEKIQVNDFLDRFANFGGHVFGEINMDGNFDASGWDPEPILNSLSMNGDALMDNGKLINMDVLKKIADELNVKMLDEETIRNLTTKFHVENGRVTLDDFTTLSRFGKWNLGGSIGFDGSLDYHGSILLTEELSKELLTKAGFQQYFQSGKRLDMPFTLKGTYAKPQVGLDMGEAIKRNLPTGDAAKNLLDKLFGN